MEPVPTLAELAAQGLARQEVDPRTSARFWRVSNEGHRLLGEVMARNGARGRKWNEEHR